MEQCVVSMPYAYFFLKGYPGNFQLKMEKEILLYAHLCDTICSLISAVRRLKLDTLKYIECGSINWKNFLIDLGRHVQFFVNRISFKFKCNSFQVPPNQAL